MGQTKWTTTTMMMKMKMMIIGHAHAYHTRGVYMRMWILSLSFPFRCTRQYQCATKYYCKSMIHLCMHISHWNLAYLYYLNMCMQTSRAAHSSQCCHCYLPIGSRFFFLVCTYWIIMQNRHKHTCKNNNSNQYYTWFYNTWLFGSWS